jgi:Protein of unknown function (DUF1572).
MADLASRTLIFLRSRITGVFPAQIREALSVLDQSQIWWRPNESSNSIGNLVLHLNGSLDLYLNHNMGGIAFERKRAAEFAERRELPKAELLAAFDAMIARAEQTFVSIDESRLSDPSPAPEKYQLLVEDLLAIATHVATHTGQILWITKMLREGSLHEAWIHSHREHAGWPKK